MQTLKLLMGLHCHQPVDNFQAIFKDAYEGSYDPFLKAVEKHPKIKLALHYSGPLLDWIARNKPDYIKRVKKLVERAQVEVLTGGYFEPVLPMIPAQDAKGQIEMLTRSIEEHFNYTPAGAWLAERVWSPSVGRVFSELGINYTLLDDFHLTQAGVKKENIFGHYSVTGAGNFSVFGSLKKLRYTMPFRDIDVTLDFLKGLYEKGARSVTFADDCEKFGFWPYTYDWVYKRGWLDKFFTAIEESDWVEAATFTEALRESEPLGSLAVPESSYAEMIGWCGGNFNNFFKKYPESNRMRNRMLEVSGRIKESKNEEAKRELYKAQSNCAYWHGVFGGIYTNHLRHGVYKHIIKAEESIGKGAPAEEVVETVKFQDDTKNIRVQNKFLSLFINPDYAGALFEIDYRPASYNLVDTMSRRYEPYHEKLMQKRPSGAALISKAADGDEAVNLYDILGVRERNLKKLLNYDSYQKFSCICHAMNVNTTLDDFIRSLHAGTDENSLLGPYSCRTESKDGRLTAELEKTNSTLKLKKCIILERGPEILMRFDIENISQEPIKLIFGVEFNWALEDKAYMRPRRQNRARRLALRDKFSKIQVDHSFKSPVNVWSFPVYTLNESERGLGKSFQETSLLFHRKLTLNGKEAFSLEAAIRVSG